ncbi:MAG: 50S ribosomal protein L3 N(5)-glutamine methyltransferase [Gammaproteobacteria bacterium]
MPNALELIESSTARLEAANLYYGHGTDNAGDDAVFLVLHALGLGYEASAEELESDADVDQVKALDGLIKKRIAQRLPSAYLTRKMWFAGLEFYVDARVLIPRSPLAELIEKGFSPFVDPLRVSRVLEIGTGSGCIALALAQQFPQAEVIATDISTAALEVAAINLNRYAQFADRVHFKCADLFPHDESGFDLIVTNPPYVPTEVIPELPDEYHAEPDLALAAGADGLQLIDKIFARAPAVLKPNGLIFFDVGDRWSLMEKTYPELPFLWCELERGGEGIGMLEKSALSTFKQSQVK